MAPVTAPSVLSSSGALLFGFGLLFVAVTAFGAMLLIGLLNPLLQRYALARPNARSAHSVPTPQGGGIAILGALVLAAWFGAAALGVEGPTALGFGPGSGFAVDVGDWSRLWTVLGAAVLVGIVGTVDDLRPLPPLPRLALQFIAMGIAVSALPDNARVLPWLPLVIERLLLVVGGAWFINLTNFMDGMDWLTVAEIVPVTGALSLFWFFGALSPPAGLVALALFGAMLGFAPFNKPVARLFLGDVGSLAIGLGVAFCLFDLATHDGLAAAILLPLYYIADSGLTLVWRLRRGDRVWEAHRHHFYQVAVARGLTVNQVLARVLVTNLALACFAAASLWQESAALSAVDVLLGTGVVALLLRDLARGRPAVERAE
ncbi:MAG: hypothetical protein ACRYGP_06600 [Janthinobacterium lividum]